MSKILIDKSTVKLALEALNTAESDYGSPAWELGQEAITALREALAQPEQEPVAWFHLHNCEAYFTTEPSKDMVENYWTPLFTSPPCPTCEALARTVMLDQTSHDNFNPDWDTQAVLVEEQQRMAKRILELEALLDGQTALLERQTARIVDLQTHIENFDGENQ